ncbi:MAG: ribosome recycling factor [Clostridia bacterium]|nr:ribosome recycling factor [Clostridia bacterium]
MAREEYKAMTAKMDKIINNFKDHLSTIRAGRANPDVLKNVNIDYYGSPAPIATVASVSVPEARVILIQPWEARLVNDIAKAIQKSDIGINPTNDGKCIRLVFPPLTEDRRKELTKEVRKESEEIKVALRNVRRDQIDELKKMEKKSEITEDDLKVAEKDIQKTLDKYIEQTEAIVNAKINEIMEL